GACIAIELAKHGAKVVLAGPRAERLEATASQIGELVSSTVVPPDVTRYPQLRTLFKKTIDRFGALQVLVNNAGVGYGGKIEDVTPAELLHMMKTNCVAPMWLIKLALPELRKHDDSMLVVVLSLS